MSATFSADKPRPQPLAALLAQKVLGFFFIYLGISNLRHSADFLIFVQGQLHLTNPTLSNLFAYTAPWMEVCYGLLLLSGRAPQAAAVIARWWLGCVFIYMGLNKALPHPEHFLQLVDQYHMVRSTWMLNAIAAALPWFEVFCGLLLLFGIAVRGSALMLIAMLVPFTAIVFKRALEISADKGLPFCAVKFDCGCGGGEVLICHKLVENTLLLLLSGWLLSGAASRFCLCFSVFREKAQTAEQPEPVMPA